MSDWELGYYDRSGNRLSRDEWAVLFGKAHRDYRIVQQDEANGIRVSTAWLGLDHNFLGLGPPLIFETMIFGLEDEDERDQWRWATEAEAIVGHIEICSAYLRTIRVISPPEKEN